MVGMAQRTVWSRRRAYWRLEVFAAGSDGNGVLASIRGRRRRTDAFWTPVVMDIGALLRFAQSLLSAVDMIVALQARGVDDCQCRATSRLLLARCRGPFYEVEVCGIAVAGRLKSGELQAVLPAAHRRPIVHVMGRDIDAFCVDVAGALAAMSSPSREVDGLNPCQQATSRRIGAPTATVAG